MRIRETLKRNRTISPRRGAGVTPLFLLLCLIAGPASAEPLVYLSSGAARPGEVLLVSVKGHRDDARPSGRFRDRPLGFFRASTGTYLALIGLDLEIATGTYRLGIEMSGPDGAGRQWSGDITVVHKEFPSRNIRVALKYVTPGAADEERARSERDRLMELFAGRSEENYLRGNFIKPVPRPVSAPFGERRVFNDEPRSHHAGTDFRAPAGTPVKAPAGGKVVLTGDLFYQGKTVMLDHGGGLFTYYIHLSEISVKEGATLPRGAVIGKVGSTGRSSGPHLHWAARLDGARVDPLSLLKLDLDGFFE